jgi:hypothetical protein
MRLALFGVFCTVSLLAACGSDPQTGTTTAAGGGGGATSSSGGGGTATTGDTTTGTGGTGGTTASGGTGGTGGTAGTGGTGGTGGSGGTTGSGGGRPVTASQCFADDFINAPTNGPDYDQFNPVIGSHCQGTNHQDITGVERVVFLGDSVTVGTPPTLSTDFYRAELADALAGKFNLQKPDFLWQAADPFNGTSITKESGDFASCSKWGARTDDLLVDNTQIGDCFPPAALSKRTLVVMTMGGNDIASLTKDATNGVAQDQLWAQTMDFVQKQRDAVKWFYEPGRFPNGVFVVFANMYEFTDGTGNVQSCDVSALAGFDKPLPQPDVLAEMVVWANEQYLSIAVETGSDMIFMLEDFCGHGFEHDNPAAPCYRGPGTEVWFDLTCIHPNPTGHDHIKDMFMAVVNE